MKAELAITMAAALLATTPGTMAAKPPICLRPTGPGQTVTGGNCLYDVAVSTGFGAGRGAIAAGTGEGHPVTEVLGGREQALFPGGKYLTPGFNSFSVRSWTSQTDYFFDKVFDTLENDKGFECFYGLLLPPAVITDIIRSDGHVTGVHAEYQAAERGDRLAVTMEIDAAGENYEDSAVRATCMVTNHDAAPVSIGWRFFTTGGVRDVSKRAYRAVPPDPPAEPWLTVEREWDYPAEDYLLISLTPTPSTKPYYYFGGMSLYGPWTLTPPPTPPDRVAFSADVEGTPPEDRYGPLNTCFDWHVPDPPRGKEPMGEIEAWAYFWNDTPETARVLAPGESASVTVWVWAFIENPVTAVVVGPADPVECAGTATAVTLDGSGSHTVEGNTLRFRWSADDPAVTFDDPSSPTPTAYLPGVGTYGITMDVGIGPYTRSQHLDVEVVDTTPPEIAGVPADVTVECDAVPEPATPTATDTCDGVLTPASTQERMDGACADAYTLLRTWAATDACGNVSSASQTLAVVDTTPPVLRDVPADTTVECDAVPPPAAPSATDNCDGAPTIAYDQRRVDGACADAYTLVRTWTATDACGNASRRSQTISVVDTTVPVLHDIPPDTTVECDHVPPPASPTASDNCDGAPAIAYDQRRIDGRSPDDYTLVRTWTARDACSNTSSGSQRVTVVDTTPPAATALLQPAEPLAPRAPSSACAPPTSRRFEVRGTATDDCDPRPALAATLLVTNHEVTRKNGPCVERVESVGVALGETFEMRLVTPPCPAKPPKQPRQALSVLSSGTRVVTGERVVLRVTATDRTGNAARVDFDATREPSPSCDERLLDGTCCPAITQPGLPADCKGGPCGGGGR